MSDPPGIKTPRTDAFVKAQEMALHAIRPDIYRSNHSIQLENAWRAAHSHARALERELDIAKSLLGAACLRLQNVHGDKIFEFEMPRHGS